MNQLTITGNVGFDAELVPVGDTQVAKFSVATNKRWKDKNGDKQEKTTWIRCELWGKRGENLAQYITKGTFVEVSGELSLDKVGEDEKGVYATLKADKFEFGPNPKSGGSSGGGDFDEDQDQETPF